MKKIFVLCVVLLSGCAYEAADVWQTGGGGERYETQVDPDHHVVVWTKLKEPGIYESRAQTNGAMFINVSNHIVAGSKAIQQVAAVKCPNGYNVLNGQWQGTEYFMIYQCK